MAQWELPEDVRWEIDEGALIVREPPGFRHGATSVVLGAVLLNFVRSRGLGHVVGEAGFHLRRGPDVLRAPDVAFLSNERVRGIADPAGFPSVAPDLAVEVVSPSNRTGYLQRKVAQWLELGVRAVWLVDPEKHTLERHGADQSLQVFRGDDAIVEEPVLPGFTCRLGDLLPQPYR